MSKSPKYIIIKKIVQDHNTLLNLTTDDHTQYALLAGRSGGQTLIGGTASGNNLTLQSTSNATKGKILFGTSAYDEVNNRLGIGTASPGQIVELSVASNDTSVAPADIGYTFQITNTDTTLNNFAGLSFGQVAGRMDAIVGAVFAGRTAGARATDLVFYTETANTLSERMRILGSGNVGIGTVSPATRFHLAGTTSSHYAQIDTGLNFSQVSAATALTPTIQALAGNVDVGDHRYTVTYITALGETGVGTPSNTVTITAGNQQVALSNIPVSSDYRVTSRKIYRTKAGGSIYMFYPLTTIANNTETTFNDNVADANLGAVSGVGIWYGVNTTNNLIRVNGNKAMTVDSFMTTFGVQAGNAGAYGGQNSLFGNQAGRQITSGANNTCMGHVAGNGITDGGGNACFGGAAGYLFNGSYNTLIGAQAGYTAGTKSNNTLIGGNAGFYLSTGSTNTFLGAYAGYSSGVTTGSSNVFLGAYAGYYETGSQKLFIDNQSRTNEATARTNSMLYGVFNATVASQTLTMNGMFGINTIPTSALHGVTTLSAATGNEIAYQLNYTTNTATSGNDTGLLINMTDTASPGTSNLLDLQVGGVSKFKVDNTGTITNTGGIITKVTVVTDTYQILVTDYAVVGNKVTDFTITLPTAVVGQIFNIKNINTGIVTLEGSGSDTIDGELNQAINQWENITVQCSANNYWIIL